MANTLKHISLNVKIVYGVYNSVHNETVDGDVYAFTNFSTLHFQDSFARSSPSTFAIRCEKKWEGEVNKWVLLDFVGILEPAEIDFPENTSSTNQSRWICNFNKLVLFCVNPIELFWKLNLNQCTAWIHTHTQNTAEYTLQCTSKDRLFHTLVH